MFALIGMIIILAVGILLATGHTLEVGDGFTEEKKHAKDASFTVKNVHDLLEKDNDNS